MEACIFFLEDFFSIAAEEMEACLHYIEKKRYDSFPHLPRKMSYLAGRFCAKKVISNISFIPDIKELLIDTGVFNQPITVYPFKKKINVCISHSGSSAIALAYPEALPMGIDIEVISLERGDIVSSQLTKGELAVFNRLQVNSTIFNLLIWTAKECLAKILKTGLTTPLNVFEIRAVSVEENHFKCTFINFIQYIAISKIYNDKIITVVSPKSKEGNDIFPPIISYQHEY